MHQVEPLQPEHAQPPAREMEQRGAAHPAVAEHDHIVWVQSSSSEVRQDPDTSLMPDLSQALPVECSSLDRHGGGPVLAHR